ncbi:MAG: SpoIIIAH-like family protein [Lachnospiraceae bacterium]
MRLTRIKNQLLVTILVLMIAVGGYFSFQLSSRDATDQAMSNSTSSGDALTGKNDESDQKDMEDAGEAVITSSKEVADYAATARMNREQVRAKSKEELQKIIDNESLSQQARDEASAALVAMTTYQDAEVAIENLLAAKGFNNVVVSITKDSVDVIVDLKVVSDTQLMQIEDIVNRKVEVDPLNIVVTPMKVE